MRQLAPRGANWRHVTPIGATWRYVAFRGVSWRYVAPRGANWRQFKIVINSQLVSIYTFVGHNSFFGQCTRAAKAEGWASSTIFLQYGIICAHRNYIMKIAPKISRAEPVPRHAAPLSLGERTRRWIPICISIIKPAPSPCSLSTNYQT